MKKKTGYHVSFTLTDRTAPEEARMTLKEVKEMLRALPDDLSWASDITLSKIVVEPAD